MPRRNEIPEDLWCIVFLENVPLEDLLAKHRLQRLERMALYKIICVLRQPARPEYSVGGSGESLSELVFHVYNNTAKWRGFVTKRDLPMPYRGYKGERANRVLKEARLLLLLRAFKDIPEEHLWYHSGLGYWQAAQSLIDKYQPLRREVRGLLVSRRPKPFNDRSYHGRPRRDRKRGMVTSISTTRSR